MNKVKFLIGSLLGVAILMGCSKEVEDKGPAPAPDPYTQVIFEFTHNVDGASLQLDTTKYENQSSNIYGVTNLQYLVGTFRLKSWNSNEHTFIDEHHLVDLKDPTTWTFRPKDTILIDDYNDLTLFLGFGHDAEKNKVDGVPDQDLNDQFGWPPKWGGGYYTMKMYGNFFPTTSSTTTLGYDMALGGKIRKETPNDTTYVDNPIFANVTQEGFSIPKGTKLVKIEIRMDLNKLFKDKWENANYNLSAFQSNIEENSVASSILSSNIENCFKLGSVTLDDEAQTQ